MKKIAVQVLLTIVAIILDYKYLLVTTWYDIQDTSERMTLTSGVGIFSAAFIYFFIWFLPSIWNEDLSCGG